MKHALLILGCWFAAGVASAQLQVTLQPQKTELLLGEPLWVTVVISNTGPQEVRLAESPLWIAEGDQGFRRHSGSPGASFSSGLRVPPQGRDITTRKVLLDWGAGGGRLQLALPRAGQYKIKVTAKPHAAGEVASEVVALTVREPVGEELVVWNVLVNLTARGPLDDAKRTPVEAWSKYYPTAHYGLFMQLRQEPWPEDFAEALTKVVAEHPQSVYSPYLAYALWRHHEGRTATRDKGREYFTKLIGMSQAPGVSEYAMWERIQFESSAAVVVSVAEQALQKFPQGAHRESFEGALAKARATLAKPKVVHWTDVADELDKLGYDVSLENVDPAIGERIKREAFDAPLADYRAGKLTAEELETEQARRYKALMMELVTPKQTDTTKPVITLLGANLVIVECGGAYADAGATATDNKDGDITARIVVENNVDTPKAGTYQVTYRVADAVGNAATATRTVKVVYKFDGFLAPIGGADATGGNYANPVRTFKLGSTIPVKFTASCGGTAVKTGVHTLQVIKYNNETTAAEPIDATPTDAATTGNQFKLAGDDWHFNLDTKATGMSTGTWQLKATLSDGSTHVVWVGLK
jgi:hypothetical protein